MSEDSPECQDAIRELVLALRPFARILDADGIGQIGGGAVIRPLVMVQWIKDAQKALKGRAAD